MQPDVSGGAFKTVGKKRDIYVKEIRTATLQIVEPLLTQRCDVWIEYFFNQVLVPCMDKCGKGHLMWIVCASPP